VPNDKEVQIKNQGMFLDLVNCFYTNIFTYVLESR
jgi:hypothetical protein